jgi:signal transduction histidine kinase
MRILSASSKFLLSVAAQGFGLMNMQNRAKKVGASLEIRSDVGDDTGIVLRLPNNT